MSSVTSVDKPRPRVGSVLSTVLLVLGVMMLALTPVRTDHDMWWHLKAGKLISEGELGLWDNDPFTYGSEDVPWHNHEWLAQWGMYQVFRLGGEVAPRLPFPHSRDIAGVWLLVLVKASILAVAFAIAMLALTRHQITPVVRVNRKRLGICPIVAATVLLIGAMGAKYSMHCRPPVITNLFLALELWLLLGRWHRHQPLRAAALALLFFGLWSNLHGGWLAGLVLIGAFGVGDFGTGVLFALRGKHRAGFVAFHQWRVRILIFIGAFLGTMLNPSGPHLYMLTVRVMSATELLSRIPEMLPPPLMATWPFYALLPLAGLGAIWLLVRSRGWGLGVALAGLFFAWQAANHLRHISLFAIIGALPAALLLQALWDLPTRGKPSRIIAGLMLAVMLALVIFISNGLPGVPWEPTKHRNFRWQLGMGYEYNNYYDDPCDVLLQVDPPGRLWTNLNIGGHLIWRLSPEHYRVYTDSRFDVHGDSRQRVEYSLNGVGPDDGVPDPNWNETLISLGVNSALLQKATPLVQAMLAHPDWDLVHEWTSPDARRWEDGTMLFIRRAPE